MDFGGKAETQIAFSDHGRAVKKAITALARDLADPRNEMSTHDTIRQWIDDYKDTGLGMSVKLLQPRRTFDRRMKVLYMVLHRDYVAPTGSEYAKRRRGDAPKAKVPTTSAIKALEARRDRAGDVYNDLFEQHRDLLARQQAHENEKAERGRPTRKQHVSTKTFRPGGGRQLGDSNSSLAE